MKLFSVSEVRNSSWEGSSCGNFCCVLGLSRTLVGMGADAAPAGQRPGPILSPWADPVRLPVSWDSSEDSYCDH